VFDVFFEKDFDKLKLPGNFDVFLLVVGCINLINNVASCIFSSRRLLVFYNRTYETIKDTFSIFIRNLNSSFRFILFFSFFFFKIIIFLYIF